MYDRAAALTLVGKPSQLAMKIIGLLCENDPPLTGCCCHKTVSGLWRKQLPPAVKAAVASSKLNGSDLEQTLHIADDVYNATQQSHPGLPVASIPSTSADLDSTQPALQHDVAAVRARGTGQASKASKPANQRAGQNSSGTKPPKNRGPRHPDQEGESSTQSFSENISKFCLPPLPKSYTGSVTIWVKQNFISVNLFKFGKI